MNQSKLQKSEIYLQDFEPGTVVVAPTRSRTTVQMQIQVRGMKLLNLSPDEAHSLGRSLVEHARECGLDEYAG